MPSGARCKRFRRERSNQMQKSTITGVALDDCPVTGQSQATSDSQASTQTAMGRIGAFLFGVMAYLVFFGTLSYAVGFVADMVVPKGIDDGPVVPTVEAMVINLVHMSMFDVLPGAETRKHSMR